MSLAAITLTFLTGASQAADGPYPFEGNWIRADRSCSASAARERIYTAHDVVATRGRCTIRKIAKSGTSFELFERCDRPNERASSVREVIRMTGPDAMVLNRQTARLKISRSLHFARCVAPAVPPKAAVSKPAR